MSLILFSPLTANPPTLADLALAEATERWAASHEGPRYMNIVPSEVTNREDTIPFAWRCLLAERTFTAEWRRRRQVQVSVFRQPYDGSSIVPLMYADSTTRVVCAVGMSWFATVRGGLTRLECFLGHRFEEFVRRTGATFVAFPQEGFVNLGARNLRQCVVADEMVPYVFEDEIRTALRRNEMIPPGIMSEQAENLARAYYLLMSAGMDGQTIYVPPKYH